MDHVASGKQCPCGCMFCQSQWHKCERWESRRLACPFQEGGEEEEEEEEKERDPAGEGQATINTAELLEALIGRELAGQGMGSLGELLGPLLAFFVLVRGIQTVRGGMQIGRVGATAISEEATVRTLRKMAPLEPGRFPRPSSPVPSARSGGGGLFVNQAAELKMMMTGRR